MLVSILVNKISQKWKTYCSRFFAYTNRNDENEQRKIWLICRGFLQHEVCDCHTYSLTPSLFQQSREAGRFECYSNEVEPKKEGTKFSTPDVTFIERNSSNNCVVTSSGA